MLAEQVTRLVRHGDRRANWAAKDVLPGLPTCSAAVHGGDALVENGLDAEHLPAACWLDSAWLRWKEEGAAADPVQALVDSELHTATFRGQARGVKLSAQYLSQR